ncbi:MAG: hypothetical protein JSW40_07460 [Candidatus Omnitrophota bacterium]|nr:MAG: hypothetical protein JSW40_07460 [Candidatus Omnitrophota bacterium]
MKKCVVFALIFFVLVNGIAFSQEAKKGASPKAYEHASQQSIFHRVTDWFATIGKSEEEKAKILEQRKNQRAAKRAEKKAKHAQEKAQKALEKSLRKQEKAKGK